MPIPGRYSGRSGTCVQLDDSPGLLVIAPAHRDAGWGLGRHTIGSNFFHYNPDPWGSWIEWFSGIDQIDDSWVAQDWDRPPHLWGASPPKTFLSNLEPRDTQ